MCSLIGVSFGFVAESWTVHRGGVTMDSVQLAAVIGNEGNEKLFREYLLRHGLLAVLERCEELGEQAPSRGEMVGCLQLLLWRAAVGPPEQRHHCLTMIAGIRFGMPIAYVWEMFYSNATFVAYHAPGVGADDRLYVRVLLEWGIKGSPALKRFLFRVAHRCSMAHMVLPPGLQQQLLDQAGGSSVTDKQLSSAVRKAAVRREVHALPPNTIQYKATGT